MLSCMFLALAIALLIWVPIYIPLMKRGALAPKSVRVIEAAEKAGRYTTAWLAHISSVGIMVQGYKNRTLERDVTYSYEVDGYSYDYVTSSVGIPTPRTLTVYWEDGKPNRAYHRGEVVQGARVVVMTAMLPITWLVAMIALHILFK